MILDPSCCCCYHHHPHYSATPHLHRSKSPSQVLPHSTQLLYTLLLLLLLLFTLTPTAAQMSGVSKLTTGTAGITAPITTPGNMNGVSTADVNGDGTMDIAVGVTSGSYDFAYIFFMAPSAVTVRSYAQITSTTGPLTAAGIADGSGQAFCQQLSFGDVNKDGIPDLACSAEGYATASGMGGLRVEG